MTNTKLDSMAAGLVRDIVTNTGLEAAADEVSRELQVRLRCYPRWVQDGKLSNTDSKDRLRRLQLTTDIMNLLVAAKAWTTEDGASFMPSPLTPEGRGVTSSGDKEAVDSAVPY